MTVLRLHHLHTVWWFLYRQFFLNPICHYIYHKSDINWQYFLSYFYGINNTTLLWRVINHRHLVHHSSTYWCRNSTDTEVSTGWNQLLARCVMPQKVHKLKFIHKLWVKNLFTIFLTSICNIIKKIQPWSDCGQHVCGCA